MDQALKAKWVKALRSGEYKQARLELRNDEGHCCLGVLCEVAGVNFSPSSDAYNQLRILTGDYGPLVTLNDDDERSFPEIATWIEENL